MSFIFKHIILLTCIFSFFIANINAANSHSHATSKNLNSSDIESLMPIYFFIGLISSAIGIGLIVEGIAQAYDIPLVPLSRIARALEQERSEEWHRKQQKGRTIIGSIIGSAGVASLLFGLLNWALVAKIITDIKK